MKSRAHGFWLILVAATVALLFNQPVMAQLQPGQPTGTDLAAEHDRSGETMRTFRRVAFIAAAALAGGVVSEFFFDIGGVYAAVLATGAAVFADWYIKEGFWPYPTEATH